MRRMIVVGLMLFLVVPPLLPSEISVRLRGGMSFISPADYNDGADGRNAYVATIASGVPEGEWGTFGSGVNFAGDVFLSLNRYSLVGIGIGFIRFHTAGRIAYQYPTTSPTLLFGGTTDEEASMRAVPILLKVRYARPVTKTISLITDLGAGIYLCSFDYRSAFVGGYMGATDWNETQTFAATKIALGVEGGIGLEIPIAKSVSAEFEVGGRFAKLSSLEGDWTDVGTSNGTSYDDGGNDGFFSVWDYQPSGGKTYRFATFDNNIRLNQPNFRKGRFDLSGLFLTCGVRITI